MYRVLVDATGAVVVFPPLVDTGSRLALDPPPPTVLPADSDAARDLLSALEASAPTP
jgi:hypothetical protein